MSPALAARLAAGSAGIFALAALGRGAEPDRRLAVEGRRIAESDRDEAGVESVLTAASVARTDESSRCQVGGSSVARR